VGLLSTAVVKNKIEADENGWREIEY